MKKWCQFSDAVKLIKSGYRFEAGETVIKNLFDCTQSELDTAVAEASKADPNQINLIPEE